MGLRDFTDDSHRTTDDYPFGGGAGMIMKIEPIDRALAGLGVGEKQARPEGKAGGLSPVHFGMGVGVRDKGSSLLVPTLRVGMPFCDALRRAHNSL